MELSIPVYKKFILESVSHLDAFSDYLKQT